MVSSNSATIVRSSAELTQPIHVSGTSTSVRALIVARFIQHFAQHGKNPRVPTIVICPNDDSASEFCEDLECISQTVLKLQLSILHFPTWERSPYSPITPSIRSRLVRLSVLSKLNKNEPPDVIVTTLAAFCQATLPVEVFNRTLISVRVNSSVQSREALVARLLEAGYLKTDPVEDPGTFAVRGDIVDVFSVDRDQPVRIELFGDEVEKIREFDAATQRATPVEKTDPIVEIVIPPARETLINRETSATLRENLKQRADDVGIPKPARDPILSLIRDAIYPDHSDIWVPFAYPSPSCLLEYLPVQSPILWCDQLTCQQEWDKFAIEQKRLGEEALETQMISPAFDTLFRWTPSLEKNIQASSRIFLDQIDLLEIDSTVGPQEQIEGEADTQKIGPKHRLFVRSNSDLNLDPNRHSLNALEPKFKLWMKQGFQILALASTQSQLERIRFLLEERRILCRQADSKDSGLSPSVINLDLGSVSQGFRWPSEGLILLTESEILGVQHSKKQRKSKTAESGSAAKDWSGLQALSDLSVGDPVVHVDHGIGRYQGLVRLDLSGAPSDFLMLEYAQKDRLYLPIYRLNVIQKYVGVVDQLALDRLGSQQFAKVKEKVKNSVKKLAIDLIQLYAARKIQPGIQFSPRDNSFREFEMQFPFDETPDQLKAIDAVMADMESGRVMDRLVCGDVGYGKTEVAIRAAFKAVIDGKQVAVLVPTTILAHQHEQSFKARMKNYPIVIESVSRFKTAKKQKVILESLAEGKIDIVIGTHRLLSKDVKFKDLGIVIVDEEHRFGVEHKERLKSIKLNTHVLTLTATPIPRTLHMSLSGLRDISLINTPPVDRLPIRTYVSKFDENLIQRAIETELARGGQVFFLHNRVQSIYSKANDIKKWVPQAQVVVGHGQMPEDELEKTMLEFYHQRANVLVCTTIIESGIDLPLANTIIVDRADSLGLAQLYQIRGRVGRGQQRAYAYLLIPSEGGISTDAKRRLEVIQKFVELGSGFSIASHDLEIRGGGDILGPQQSGNIAAVGFELYTELLEEAIQELQGKPMEPQNSLREPEIKAPFPSYLGEDYVSDVHQRLSLYRRFSAASKEGEVDQLEEELQDRFGSLPLEAQNLTWLIRIKILLKRMGIETLTVGPEKISLSPGPSTQINTVRIIALVSAYPSRYQLTPDSRIIVQLATHSLRDLFFALEKLFKDFSSS